MVLAANAAVSAPAEAALPDSTAAMPASTEATGLRRRHRVPAVKPAPPPASQRVARKSRPGSGAMLLVCVIITASLTVAAVSFANARVNAPGRVPGAFSQDAAMRHVRVIAEKPRVIGSRALNDALLYVQAKLELLRPVAESNGMALDVHFFRSGPGSYATAVANIDLVLSYSNLSSVVARLRPLHPDSREGSLTNASSLLINAHVDSAIGSPGGSDNVAGVGVALEVARCIASTKRHVNRLQRPIVFLFNGAEEAVLPGAHSFVTQHPWAPPIAAHINLESIGSGDAYHLFRLGPNAPWLAFTYGRATSVPVASVTATDMFEAKIIPGETDFRVFDEFANIPGFDFALLDNGNIYHTDRDDSEHVSLRGLAHGGRTVYELAFELAGNSDAIGKRFNGHADARESLYGHVSTAATRIASKLGFAPHPQGGRVVFFDLLRLTTIVYGEEVAVVLNVMALCFAALIWTFKLYSMGRVSAFGSVHMCVVMLGTVLSAGLSATFAAMVYSEVIGGKLLWYGSWQTAMLMYGPPAVVGATTGLILLLPRRLSVNRSDQMLFAISLLLSVILAVCTWYEFMTGYIFLSILCMANLCAICGMGRFGNPVLRHVLLVLPGALIGSTVWTTTLKAMLPLLGRVRSIQIPHEVIAALLITSTMWLYFILPALPTLCHYAQGLRVLRSSAFLLCVITACWVTTIHPLMLKGEPSPTPVYSTDAPKRLLVMHFNSPQQEPESVIAVAAQDPIPLDTMTIMRPLLDGDGDLESLKSVPKWGTLNSTWLEAFRPFRLFLVDADVFKTSLAPRLEAPRARVLEEKSFSLSGKPLVNVSIEISAVDCHQLTFRFAIGMEAVVQAWSLNPPFGVDSCLGWTRHFGTETMSLWVVVPGITDASETTGKIRPDITIAVSSARNGKSRSDLLDKLHLEPWHAPIFVQSVGVEFNL